MVLLGEVRDGLTELGAVRAADRVRATLWERGGWRRGRRGYGAELSPREREVVALVVTGRSNREIADALSRSPRTIEAQVKSAMRKLGVTSRTALAVAAVKSGVESP